MLSKTVIGQCIDAMRNALDSIEEELEKAAETQQAAAARRGRIQIRDLIGHAKWLRKYTLDRGKR